MAETCRRCGYFDCRCGRSAYEGRGRGQHKSERMKQLEARNTELEAEIERLKEEIKKYERMCLEIKIEKELKRRAGLTKP